MTKSLDAQVKSGRAPKRGRRLRWLRRPPPPKEQYVALFTTHPHCVHYIEWWSNRRSKTCPQNIWDTWPPILLGSLSHREAFLKRVGNSFLWPSRWQMNISFCLPVREIRVESFAPGVRRRTRFGYVFPRALQRRWRLQWSTTTQGRRRRRRVGLLAKGPLHTPVAGPGPERRKRSPKTDYMCVTTKDYNTTPPRGALL